MSPLVVIEIEIFRSDECVKLKYEAFASHLTNV